MTEYKVWTVKEPYLNIHCSLGEAPLYEPATNTLRFVDIKKRHLHTLSLASPLSDPEAPGDALFTLQLDMPVGVTADIEGVDPAKKILVGGKSGVAIMDRKTGQHELLQRFYDSKENDDRLRSNDGAVDPQGRFWIGTMNDFHVGPPQAEGSLFRFNHDLARHSLKSELVIPNGLGWSADQKTMYFTHSQEGKIYAFDYEASAGNLSNERIFYQHPQDKGGEPDGFAMDVEGNIWQCVYGEGRVLKISTEGKEGKVIGEIKLPTSNITCPTFIGTELWITTAGEDDETKVESKKYGGGLFKVDVGVEGKPKYKFKMEKLHSS